MSKLKPTINWSRVTPHLRRLKTNVERGLIDPTSLPMRLLDLFMDHGEAGSLEVAEHYAQLEQTAGFTKEILDLLIERVEAKLKQGTLRFPDDPHSQLCDEIADEFDLWDDEDRFPSWLSRVIAGVVEDWKWDQVDSSDPKPTFRSAEAEASGTYPSTELEGGFEGEGEEIE